jgi:predicted Zn-dependent protease
VPRDAERKIGEVMFEQVTEDERIDSARTRLIRDFAKEIDFEGDYTPKIVVIEQPEMNAFAIPGGYIVVYDSILNAIKTPEELAGLLAHEYSHVQQRHTLQQVGQQASTYLMIQLVFGDAGGALAYFVQQAAQLKSLAYSREMEQEADLKGLQILTDNDIDPKGMVSLMERLKEAHGSSIPEFVSSHPDTEARIAYLQAAIKKADVQPAPHTNMAELFAQLKKGKAEKADW